MSLSLCRDFSASVCTRGGGRPSAEVLEAFIARAPCSVDILPLPGGPSVAELAATGVARISYASLLHRESVERFEERLRMLASEAGAGGASG